MKPWNRMVPREVPFRVLLGLSLEVDTKSTSQEKSAVLITSMSIIKSTIPSLLRKNQLERIPSFPETRYTCTLCLLFISSIMENVFLRQLVCSKIGLCWCVWETQAALGNGKVGQGKAYVKAKWGKPTLCGWQNWPQSYPCHGGFCLVAVVAVAFQTMVRISRELLMRTAVSCFRTWWPQWCGWGLLGTVGYLDTA